jgi:hypothetical protein
MLATLKAAQASEASEREGEREKNVGCVFFAAALRMVED